MTESLAARLARHLRPDVVVVSVVPAADGLRFGTEVGWLPAAMETGAVVVAEVNHGLPVAGGAQRPPAPVHVVAETEHRPIDVPAPASDPVLSKIGAAVAALVSEGAERAEALEALWAAPTPQEPDLLACGR